MARKIILLSDGTGNSSAKVWRTNVWRTFEALDLSGSDQVAYYDDGVGTSSFKPMAILGGVFGFGLKRNVIALYKFACRNYRGPDDEFFAFGFSRGAFTIRIVVGLILSEGLVRADNESELNRGAIDAYRRYRRKTSHTLWPGRPEDMFRNIRDGVLDLSRAMGRLRTPAPADAIRDFTVRFVGVWDTVSAYGLPIDEMTRGVSKWILPLALPNHGFDPAKIVRGCQALALDEERTTFHPELWNEAFQNPGDIDISRRRFIGDDPVSQVWFSGVHSNVGGGYPDDSLAYIPFVWMLKEAQRCGLRFKSDYSDIAPAPVPTNAVIADPDTFKFFKPKADKDGRLYDPRKGLGGYYRYGPRKLIDICTPKLAKKEDDEIIVVRPKIHETVFKRIANRAHAYAPIGLPAIYDVVTGDGEILTPDQFWQRFPLVGEKNTEAARRALAQEHVWNEVWKRRVAYFATLLSTFWLLSLPFLADPEANAERYSKIRWLSDIIRKLGQFLPSFTLPWIDGYARTPVLFITAVGLVTVCLAAGAYYAGTINDKMSALWRKQATSSGEPTNWIYRLRSSRSYQYAIVGLKRTAAPAFFAFLFIWLAVVSLNKASFTLYDTAGWTCTKATDKNGLPMPRAVGKEPVWEEFDIANPCNSTRIKLEGNGARYRVTITFGNNPEDQWRDASIAIPPGGYLASKADPEFQPPGALDGPNHLIEEASWGYRLRMLAFVPFRRIYAQDWFRIVLRIDDAGAEHEFYRPDVHDRQIQWVIKPKREGELFIFVNDVVLGVPSAYGLFYKNNHGKGTVSVVRL